MLVVKASKIRSTNGDLIQIPEKPFVREKEGENEFLGKHLLPTTADLGEFLTPEGYHPPLLYVQEKLTDVIAYKPTGKGILEVTTTYAQRFTSTVYVPHTNESPIFGVGRKDQIVRAFQMLRAFAGQDAHIALDGINFDIRKVEAAYPNDHWTYSFEDEQGYIQKGIVYGNRLNQDSLTPQIKKRGFPNQVGIYITAKTSMLKIRVLNDGIQFHGFTQKHLLNGHPELGNPWPFIVSAMQKMASI